MEGRKGMQEFLKAVNQFRSRRKRKKVGIKKQDWVRHFKDLLGGVEIGEEEEQRNFREETEPETGREEEAEELNKEIKIEEIGKALGKMKNNKAAGEDGIKIEFIKEVSRNWAEEISEILNIIFNKGEMIKV